MRPQLRIPAARFATLALVLVTWIALGSGPARSSCPGPTLVIDGVKESSDRRPVPVGATVTITGFYFEEGCNDVAGPCTGGGGIEPMEDVEVYLVPARWEGDNPYRWRPTGPAVSLGTRDADGGGAFVIEDVTLPSSPGRYVLVARRQDVQDPVAIRGLVPE